MNKKISVIIPCYNVENYIDRCLQSIVRQTIGLESLEIICVDDCSTDSTLKRLKVWEEKYQDNLLLVECSTNGHLGCARNIGLSYATCDYAAFIDSDDWVELNYFEILYDIAVSGNYQVVACEHIRDSGAEPGQQLAEPGSGSQRTDRYDRKYIISREDERKIFFHTQPLKLYAWGKLVKRNFLTENSIVFPEHLTYEDVIYGNDLYMYADRCCAIPDKLYHYFVKDDSLVLKKDSMHHIDHFTINELLWRDWIQRGFFEKYRDELIYEYLYDAYLAVLKILVFRFEQPPFPLFRLLQEQVREKIPQNTACRYFENGEIPDFHKMLIDFVYMDINKEQFNQVVEKIKVIGL